MSEARRQLAAIVFTDAVGSTQSMRMDEESTLAQLRSDHDLMRECCAHFEGEVLKSMGDGLMMLFQSASQAVLCALDIQGRLGDNQSSNLKHRIGVHLGDVVVSPNDAHGDGVNVAARLEEMAEPGTVCISKTVLDVARSRLRFEPTPLGPKELKGLDEVMEVFQIAPGDPPKRAPKPSRQRGLAPIAIGAAAVVAVTALVTKPWQQPQVSAQVAPPVKRDIDPDLRDSVLEILRESAKAAKADQANPKSPPTPPIKTGSAGEASKPKPIAEGNKEEIVVAKPSEPKGASDGVSDIPDPASIDAAIKEAVAEAPKAADPPAKPDGLKEYDTESAAFWATRDFGGMVTWLKTQPNQDSAEIGKAEKHWQAMADFKDWYLSEIDRYTEAKPLLVGSSDSKKSFRFWGGPDEDIHFVGPGGKARGFKFASIPLRFIQLSAPPMLDDSSDPMAMLKGLQALKTENARHK